MNKDLGNKEARMNSEKQLWKVPIKYYPGVRVSSSAMMGKLLSGLPVNCKQFDNWKTVLRHWTRAIAQFWSIYQNKKWDLWWLDFYLVIFWTAARERKTSRHDVLVELRSQVLEIKETKVAQIDGNYCSEKRSYAEKVPENCGRLPLSVLLNMLYILRQKMPGNKLPGRCK